MEADVATAFGGVQLKESRRGTFSTSQYRQGGDAVFKRINVIAGLAPATATTTSRALLKAALAVALVSSFSIALLLSSTAVALGAPSQADERAFTSGAEAAFGVTPLAEAAPPEV
jgi:hypothetical protein